MGCSETLLRKYTSSTTGVGLVGHGCRTRGARVSDPWGMEVHFVDINNCTLRLNNLLLMFIGFSREEVVAEKKSPAHLRCGRALFVCL